MTDPEQPTESPPTPPAGPLAVALKFRPTGKVYLYEAGSLGLHAGDRVLAQTEKGGTGLATVVAEPLPAKPSAKGSLPRVVRRADNRDLAREEANLERARDAQRLCAGRIRERRMPMKVIQADCTFDGSKVVIYFFAEDRVDFRDLVRDLAQTLHTRIEMKQVGPRDETKLVGGLGPCGRELCCSSWLREFNAVSVKMAKEQGLSLNPSKLAGMCGRLKCCLRYEYDSYVQLGRSLPALGSAVESVKGNGNVVRHNLLKQTVVIRREADGTEAEASLEDLVAQKN